MLTRGKINWPVSFAVWTAGGAVLAAQTLATVDLPAADASEERVNFWATVFFQITRAWLWCLLAPVVFELRRRLPVRGWWLPAAVAVHAAFGALLVVSILAVRTWTMQALLLNVPLGMLSIDDVVAALSSRQLIDVALYLVLLGVGYTLDLSQEKEDSDRCGQELRVQLAVKQLQEEQLRSEIVRAEMKALKQQLHPHFLFNALNAVSGLVRQHENDRAVEALSQVSALLRALIGSTGASEVTLEQEITYCETYLSIEKMRFDERLSYSFDIAPQAAGAIVPTLLLQPMVENAIKHGIACRRNPGWVRVRARVAGPMLQLEVQNDPAERPKGQSAPESHGVGLETTRKRLDRAFGARSFSLSCMVNTPRGTLVTLELPFRPAEPSLSL